MTNSNSTKHFVELAKAWINDKDKEMLPQDMKNAMDKVGQ